VCGMRKNKRRLRTPEQAIKAKCLECSGGQKIEVEFCPVLDCPLWPYRKGFENKEIPISQPSKALWEEDDIEIEE